MAVGDTLHRIARSGCSSELCSGVLEPAIADLQHQYAHAGRVQRGALLGGYAAFWCSFLWCLARDAGTKESRAHLVRTGAAFALVVGVMAAAEALFLHTDDNLRQAALRALYWGPVLPYVGWSARLNTATLLFGVPLAMFPVLLFAARRRANVTSGTALLTVAAGTLLTIVSSGWIAPAVVRWDAIRARERTIIARSDGFRASPMMGFEECPDCSAWPGLIRGAIAPLKHRYPGYPDYVAPEDRFLPGWYRSVIRERLLLIAFAMLAGLAGWWLGTWDVVRRSG
jgi:hypothetical protein